MKKFLLLGFLFMTFFVYANEIEFIDNLDKQKTASYYDCIKVFSYLNKLEVTGDFNTDVEALKAVINKLPRNYKEDQKLTIGTFSLLAMQQMKIESGLFYLMTHSGRYASRELIIRGILPFNTSEWELLSGSDLIRNIQKVVEYAEEKSK
jgi:hypothetical protein